MGLSINEFTYNGGPQQFAVNFALGYISKDDIEVYVKDELDGLGAIVFRDFVWINDGVVEVTEPIIIGKVVVVQRTVSKTALVVNFNNEGSATRANVQRGLTQAMMAMHEFIDGRVSDLESLYPFSEYIATMQQLYVDSLAAQGVAEASAVAAQAAQTAAEAAAADAVTQAVAAARPWADNPEDAEVIPGAYSALHWSEKARAYAEIVSSGVPDASPVQRGLVTIATEGEIDAGTAGDAVVPNVDGLERRVQAAFAVVGFTVDFANLKLQFDYGSDGDTLDEDDYQSIELVPAHVQYDVDGADGRFITTI